MIRKNKTNTKIDLSDRDGIIKLFKIKQDNLKFIKISETKHTIKIECINSVTAKFDDINNFVQDDSKSISYFKGVTNEIYLSEEFDDFLSDINKDRTSILSRVSVPEHFIGNNILIIHRTSLFTKNIIRNIPRDKIKFVTGVDYFMELIMSGKLPSQAIENMYPSEVKLFFILWRMNELRNSFKKILLKDLIKYMGMHVRSQDTVYKYLEELRKKNMITYIIGEKKPKELKFEITYVLRCNFSDRYPKVTVN